ncbi:DNA REPAIR XP-C / RAD4 domain containing protein,putative [Babesia bigemina]|uniref:DNA REPAIR XP-C / RAD4 domain containing protein,putative n=1 Tax=Babesia bigemina TaxID=5866 RepID=A0A061DCT9_BABBI|nr:DNA REPAIR XP-C / RAD4 domain containing protein,putative [Babesia bigemina]CDR95760.1 DNA REPAIR XP-C / RAD4 domain containing protein,putative [Babesia bigemina]|eukprot:XP_012767946.1 DNA REPAIR XP-C / RAD4 domain containing protein,putative [Babesia bigemina]
MPLNPTQALVFSYFENFYSGPAEPLAIFKHIQEHFSILPELRTDTTRNGRGKVLLRLLRCLHLHKGSSDTLTLLYVCACRCYGVSARLVEAVHGPANGVLLLAESFDPDSGSWKRVDFSRLKYGGVAYDPTKSAKPCNREKAVEYAPSESSEYGGRLYVQRDNKLFVYKREPDLRVVAILVSRSRRPSQAVLNVSEFRFEEEEFRQRLVRDKQKPGAKDARQEFHYVFGCNKYGWLSEITPKYVERYNDVCVKRGKELQAWLVQTIERLNEPVKSVSGAGIVSMLERAESKWMETRVSNDPLPDSKARLKNHPVYVLASQIGSNHILKKDATPIAFLKGEEVYLRCDLEALKTRGAWRKANRRVLDDVQPITTRKTYNRNTRMHVNTSLFSESQTELIPQEVATDGSIPTTEYDNVDVTGQRFVPQGTIYLRTKRLDLLLRAANALQLHYKRAFSSYQKTDTFKPEIDGIVIQKANLPALLQKYEELAMEAATKALEEKKESYRNFWRSVFKTMLADPPSVAQEHHNKIRRELNEHVTHFLNRVEHLT